MSIRSNSGRDPLAAQARMPTEVLNYRIADSIRPPET